MSNPLTYDELVLFIDELGEVGRRISASSTETPISKCMHYEAMFRLMRDSKEFPEVIRVELYKLKQCKEGGGESE